MKARDRAAFFRVEGTLLDSGPLASSAYFAANAQSFRDRFLGLGQLALSTPFFAWYRQNDRTMANRIAYLPIRGMSEDRVTVLGEEFYEDILKEKKISEGWQTIEEVRRRGHKIILVSEAISQVIDPLAQELSHVDDVICNRLEFCHGHATGKLLDPVIGGPTSIRWLQDYALSHRIDLSTSCAYAAQGSDILLLAAFGQPCAINPDYRLRQTAKEARWPIVEIHS